MKIVRHGYDRYGILHLSNVSVAEFGSVGFWFKPDWSGKDDTAVHGLFGFKSKDFRYSIVKNGKNVDFTIQSAGGKQSVSIPAEKLAKNKFYYIAAGYDFQKKVFYLSIDSNKKEGKLTVSAPAKRMTGGIVVGDILDVQDMYSKSQSEGLTDELLMVNEYLSPAELEKALAQKIRKKSQKEIKGIVNSPVKEQEKTLWDLSGAEVKETAARKLITLNALWRCQLTDEKRAFNPNDWLYLAVPGRYSGQANGYTDSEFYFRDKNLRKMARNINYNGKSPYRYVNGWFERAFKADPSWKGKDILLLIDELSLSQKGTVYLNGKFLAELDYGFKFEIPIPENKLNFNDYNYLTIHTVDDGQYWAWRGIKGDVSLEIRNKLTLKHPSIVTSVKNKTFEYGITLKNSSSKTETLQAEAVIRDKNAPAALRSEKVTLKPGESRTVRAKTSWENPELWSTETPNLYYATFRVLDSNGKIQDELYPVRFGFREFEIRGRDFYLNGKKIHLFIADTWYNSNDPEECRRVAASLKKLGFNTLRSDFGPKDKIEENIMRICDETGILVQMNALGVSGREYALWNDPAIRKNLEERMAAKIRIYCNNPSTVMWYLSVNFLGYAWDYHPLKIADGYAPQNSAHKNKASVCMEGAKILYKYDDSKRPFFFQAGGNHGPIINMNGYFCWWPQTDHNAWPAEWNKTGKKPLMNIETSFPYHASYYGMDLQHSGNKELFYFENLARYYGPSAYKPEGAIEKQIANTTRGKNGTLWRDSIGFQKLKADLILETLRYWRGFDISGFSPFAEAGYAFDSNAPRHSPHTAKEWSVQVKDFRRFGWNQDLKKIWYQADIKHDAPTPAGHALKAALAPRLMFIDGGNKEPVDKTHNYYSGAKTEKRIVLVNDTLKESEFSGKWSFAGKSGSFSETLKPGETKRIPLSLTMPKVAKRTEFELVVTGNNLTKQNFKFTVFPQVKTKVSGVALYDTKNLSSAMLKRLNLKFADASKLSSLKGVRLLVIGRESLTPEFMALAKRLGLRAAVESGKTNVIVLEQKPEGLSLLGLKTMPIYARDVFTGTGFSLSGVADSDYSQWAGDGTLAPAKQPPAPETEDTMQSPFWHWNNANIVAAYPVRRPAEGNPQILLSCGKDLIYTPLFEMNSGKGKVVFSQLEFSGRSQNDAGADHIISGLIQKYAKSNPSKKAVELLTPEKISADEVNALLEKVKSGAVLIVPAGYSKLFGVETKAETVNFFSITNSGRIYWPLLTARDSYLRAPQKLNVVSGADIIPLTTPAFAAEKTVGKGKVIFLEIPKDIQKSRKAAGMKLGKNSSILWSAEIVSERLQYLRNAVEDFYGRKTESIAGRFENMLIPSRYISLNGEWKLRTDPKKEGVKLGWNKAADFANNANWKTVKIPSTFHDLGKYLGYIWVRRTVELPEDMRGKEMYLDIGAVDDLDDAYVNGVHIGRTGKETSGYWQVRRYYRIPAELTKSGKLAISVRVDNIYLFGGILNYIRLTVPAGKDANHTAFPYTGVNGTYHTESHIRW